MKTLKTLTAALALTLGVGFATAASAETFAGHASVKATKIQYNRGYDGGYDRGRDYDRDGVPNRYDRDRDNDGVPNRYDRNDYRPNYRGRGGYGGGYGFAPTRYSRPWDWDGDGVPNRRDARPRNPWRW